MIYKVIVICFVATACGSLSPTTRGKLTATNQMTQDSSTETDSVLISRGTKTQQIDQKADAWWYAALH